MSGDSQWMLPPEIFVYLSELFPDGGKILEFGREMEHEYLLKTSMFAQLNMMKCG